MTTVTISARFVQDREGRELDCGEVTRAGVRLVHCHAPAAVLADMVDDAAYQGWFTDADVGLRLSAQAAFRQLVEQGVPYAKGTKRRNGRVAPGDL